MNTINFEKYEVNQADRSIVFSCCSETPCIRYDEQHEIEYEQILIINENSVDLSRLKNGAPVLFNHDTDKLLGMVEDAYIIGDKVFVKVRFSENDDFANRIWNDILSGLIKNVSIGYQIEKYSDKQENGINKRYVDFFQIYEVSIVSIPADNDVGIRKLKPLNNKGKKSMKRAKKQIEKQVEKETEIEVEKQPEIEAEKETEIEVDKETETEKVEQPEIEAETETVEFDKENEIAILKQENEALKKTIEEMQNKACGDALDDADTNRQEIEKIAEDFNVEKQEVERAIQNKLTVREFKQNIRNNNIKIEVKNTMNNSKRDFQDYLKSRNFDKPFVLRDFTGYGASLIGTDTIELVPALEKIMGVKGFRTLNGLHYNVSIPVQTGRNTIYQTADLRTAATTSNPAFTNKVLTPVKLSGNTVIGTELIVQANDDIVGFVMSSLEKEIAYKLQDFLLSKVVSANPAEINYASLSAIDWSDILDFEKSVGAYALNDLAFVMSPAARAALKGTPKTANYPAFLCQDNMINGYECRVSGCVTNDNIYFGDWSKLILGVFGEGLDILVNPYKYSTEGMIEVTASICVDAVVEQTDAFALGKVQESSSSSEAESSSEE